MVEVEFRFPSNKPFAYVGVKGTAEELGLESLEPGYLAREYADRLLTYVSEEKAALTNTAPAPTAVERTVEDALADELGAVKVSESDKKPWEKADANSAPADKKPWESSASTDDDWDI